MVTPTQWHMVTPTQWHIPIAMPTIWDMTITLAAIQEILDMAITLAAIQPQLLNFMEEVSMSQLRLT